MTRVSHWYGRLGNNIQQVAVATMAAEILKSTFTLDIDHEIINEVIYLIKPVTQC